MTEQVIGGKLMTLTVEVGAPVTVGEVQGRLRRYIPLTGGTVEGTYSGRIAPGGADWQIVAPSGRIDLSARYVLQLAEGNVEVRSEGVRAGSPEVLARLAAGEIVPGDTYYFRTAMRFFTGCPALAALNDMLAIAVGQRFPSYVQLDVYPVL